MIANRHMPTRGVDQMNSRRGDVKESKPSLNVSNNLVVPAEILAKRFSTRIKAKWSLLDCVDAS